MVFYNYLCIEYSMVSPDSFSRFCCFYQPHNDSNILFCRSGNGQFCVRQKKYWTFPILIVYVDSFENWTCVHNFHLGLIVLPFVRHQDYYFRFKTNYSYNRGLLFNSVIMVDKSNMADWVSEVLTRKLHCSCFVSLRGTDSSLVCFIWYFNKLAKNFYNSTTLCS